MTPIGAIRLGLGWARLGSASSRLQNYLTQAGIISDSQTRRVLQHGTLQDNVV